MQSKQLSKEILHWLNPSGASLSLADCTSAIINITCQFDMAIGVQENAT